MNISKVILVNKAASEKKYGKLGWNKIEKAIDKLIVADKERGLVSQVFEINSKLQMKTVGGKPVTQTSNTSQVKQAIDAIFCAAQPHYLMILGGPDLIPYVQLKNPINVGKKEDEFVPSDLPYACDAKYSLDIRDFIGPTRVLGRLPDVSGWSEPDYLIKLLDVAANWKSKNRKAYSNYFGISTFVWRESTRKNVFKLFGTTKKLQIVPNKKLPWSKQKLKPRFHFINCHGADINSFFYGEKERQFPEAHSSKQIAGHITPGTVVAAECCFGAQLYSPIPEEPNMGIANRYLLESAYGFLGSTNVAWGSPNKVELADRMCQYFISHLQNGASLGRALLETRQKFIKMEAPVGPHSLKTLAQFTLLGDPSIHPIRPSGRVKKSIVVNPKSVSGEIIAQTNKQLDPQSLFKKFGEIKEIIEQRENRRFALFQDGLELTRKIATVRTDPEELINKPLEDQFKNMLKEKIYEATINITTYIVDEAIDLIKAKTASEKKRAAGGTRFMVAIVDDVVADGKGAIQKSSLKESTDKDMVPHITKQRMLVAIEKDGTIMSCHEYLTH